MVHPNLENYTITFSRESLKYLRTLEKRDSHRILKKVQELCTNVEHLDIKKLKSVQHNLYRLRVGSFRVVYMIEHDQVIVDIVRIGHRKEIYRSLQK